MEFIKELAFDARGLIPVVVQDASNGEILMLAWMNEQSLQQTLKTGKTHFWSRSRKKLWLKGEHSGHFQTVKEIYLDCDGDTLLIKVEQKGGACHTGYRSCFYRKVEEEGKLVIRGEKVFEPHQVYGDLTPIHQP